MTELALIAPTSQLHYCCRKRIQMMIPEPAKTDLAYQDYYRDHVRSHHLSSYIMLDNGAWETIAMSAEDLIALALEFKVHEVVVPDTINDPLMSQDQLKVFLEVYSSYRRLNMSLYMPQLMTVAHGNFMGEAQMFIKHVAENFPQVKTMSAGRAFTRRIGDPQARSHLFSWAAAMYPGRFQYHLLGYSDEWPQELEVMSHFVRSVDTSAPFNYAFNAQRLSQPDNSRPTGDRPNDLFSQPTEAFDVDLTCQNIDTLERWAGDTRSTV